MASRMREAVVPAYLLLCLLLGGSVQGVWFNMILQLVGLAIVAWAALESDQSTPMPLARFICFCSSAISGPSQGTAAGDGASMGLAAAIGLSVAAGDFSVS